MVCPIDACLPWLWSGMPILRPLLLQFPTDGGTRQIVDEWLLGPDLLVAPAGVGSATGKADTLARDIYFPGESQSQLWYSYWDASTATAVRGGATRTVPTPVNYAPLYVRGGAVMAMLAEQQLGLAADVEEGTTEQEHGLHVIVALSHPETGTASGTLFIDDGVSVYDGNVPHATAPRLLVNFEAATRRLVSNPDAAHSSLLSVEAAAFPTVVNTVTIFGVGIGITEIMLSTLGPSGSPVHTRVIPNADYTWDPATGVLSVTKLRQTMTAPWALEWTI